MVKKYCNYQILTTNEKKERRIWCVIRNTPKTKMTKNDLVEKLHSESGISKKAICAVLEALPVVIVDAVKAGDKVTIQGLGTFEAATRKEREGRNPQTGEKMMLPSTRRIKYTASVVAKRKLKES